MSSTDSPPEMGWGRFAEDPGAFGIGTPVPDASWGELVRPMPVTVAQRRAMLATQRQRLRVAVFGSYWRGVLMSDCLRGVEIEPAGMVEIVGVATDNLIESDARITRAKRVWRYLPPGRVEAQQLTMMTANLCAGIPVYTGPTKAESFVSGVLPRWDPQVILMGTSGQRIEEGVFSYPEYGMYNFHPSDLSAGEYPGADPFTEMIKARETQTCVTVHEVDEGFDTGRPIGESLRIATGYEVLSRLPVDADALWPHWIDALHCVTGFAAADMAYAVVAEIDATKQRMEPTDFRNASHKSEYFDTAVVAATVESALAAGLLTRSQLHAFRSVPAVAIGIGRVGGASAVAL